MSTANGKLLNYSRHKKSRRYLTHERTNTKHHKLGGTDLGATKAWAPAAQATAMTADFIFAVVGGRGKGETEACRRVGEIVIGKGEGCRVAGEENIGWSEIMTSSRH